jgi:hypothetical protein
VNISNNILKYYLRNVYIIGGNACAGKSTVAKALAKKYGLLLYQMDEHYNKHRVIANEIEQPNMCNPRDDIYQFFNRPVLQYADSLQKAIKEEIPMILLDLIKLSQKTPVIADVLFTSDDIEGIIPIDRAVFFTSTRSLVEKDYFNRPEKREFCECIRSFPDADKSFENVFNVVDLINKREKDIISKSDYLSIARTEDSKVDEVVKMVEKHLGF